MGGRGGGGCSFLLHNFWFFSCLLGSSLCDYLIDVPSEGIFKLGASPGAAEFSEWVINIFVSNHKAHQASWISMVSSCLYYCHSSWNHFLCLYLSNISFALKVKFWQTSISCKSFLKAAKFAYVNKKSVTLPRNLVLGIFGKLLVGVFNKDKSATLPLFNDCEVCVLDLIKQNFLLKTFLRILILMTHISFYLLSLQEPI